MLRVPIAEVVSLSGPGGHELEMSAASGLSHGEPYRLNLINIYGEIVGKSLPDVLLEMQGREFSYLKNELSEALIEIICPIGKKIQKLLDDKVYLEGVLRKGQEKAQIKSEENLKKIREIVGLL